MAEKFLLRGDCVCECVCARACVGACVEDGLIRVGSGVQTCLARIQLVGQTHTIGCGKRLQINTHTVGWGSTHTVGWGSTHTVGWGSTHSWLGQHTHTHTHTHALTHTLAHKAAGCYTAAQFSRQCGYPTSDARCDPVLESACGWVRQARGVCVGGGGDVLSDVDRRVH